MFAWINQIAEAFKGSDDPHVQAIGKLLEALSRLGEWMASHIDLIIKFLDVVVVKKMLDALGVTDAVKGLVDAGIGVGIINAIKGLGAGTAEGSAAGGGLLGFLGGALKFLGPAGAFLGGVLAPRTNGDFDMDAFDAEGGNAFVYRSRYGFQMEGGNGSDVNVSEVLSRVDSMYELSQRLAGRVTESIQDKH